MTLWVYHLVAQKFCHNFTMVLRFIEVCRHFLHSSIKVRQIYWLDHCNTLIHFFFRTGIIALLYDAVLAKIKLLNSCPCTWLKNALVYKGVPRRLSDCKVLRFYGCKINPNHHRSTTEVDRWCEVLWLFFLPEWPQTSSTLLHRFLGLFSVTMQPCSLLGNRQEERAEQANDNICRLC